MAELWKQNFDNMIESCCFDGFWILYGSDSFNNGTSVQVLIFRCSYMFIYMIPRRVGGVLVRATAQMFQLSSGIRLQVSGWDSVGETFEKLNIMKIGFSQNKSKHQICWFVARLGWGRPQSVHKGKLWWKNKGNTFILVIKM